MAKANPDRVIPSYALAALRETTERTKLWTAYIMTHYHRTGNLAPGCDVKDLIAWCEQNVPAWATMWDGKGKRIEL